MTETQTRDPLVPFVLPQTLSNGMRMGHGRLFFVTVAANTDTAITHNLGRVPHFVQNLDNGATFTAKVKRSATAWTPQTVTVQFDTALSNGVVWVV